MDAIIFLHTGLADYLTPFGYRDYLRPVLRQARASNPRARIVVLGDQRNASVQDLAEHQLCASFDSGAAEFRRRYVHLSRNAFGGERFCLERWFVIRDFCRAQGITSFFAADSDVVIFSDVAAVRSRMGAFDLSLSGETCGHASYWTSLSVLEAFCEYVLRAYAFEDASLTRQLMNFYRPFPETGAGGGICDMTLLQLFSGRSGVRVVETTEIIAGQTFDHNINFGANGRHEFETRGGLKAITWREGKPHGRRADTGEFVGFHILHCQGPAKRSIEGLVRGKSPVSMTHRLVGAARPVLSGARSAVRSVKPAAKSLVQSVKGSKP